MSDLLDEAQAAEHLTVSPRTVRRLVARGELRRIKVGGSTRYRLAELERYLRVQETRKAA